MDEMTVEEVLQRLRENPSDEAAIYAIQEAFALRDEVMDIIRVDARNHQYTHYDRLMNRAHARLERDELPHEEAR